MSQLSSPEAKVKSEPDDRIRDKKKVSCVHCRRIKRKCDGNQPCRNCFKKNVSCEYSQMDRRTQRYSIGYIKSLETNNEVYESTLSHLVLLRNDPEELVAKLEALATSYPGLDRLGDMASDLEEDVQPRSSDEDDTIEPMLNEPYQYFGPGSIYHYLRFTRPDKEPIIGVNSPQTHAVVTLEDNFEYVQSLVHGYFEQQNPDLFRYMFDKDVVLTALDARDFLGPYLNELLVYSICANCEALCYAEADAYSDFVLQRLFTDIASSSVAVSQCYTMLAIHAFGKGQMLKGWLFTGLGIRAGLEVGFDIEKDSEVPLATNRCFMATLLIDTYVCMSLGRKPTILPIILPVLRLPSESDVDFFTLKYCVELMNMTRGMLHATYKPVLFDEDPRVNYLLKFNRSKTFNVKLLKWKLALDPCCLWSYSLMKHSTNLTQENHVLKYFYYYVLLFLNKPFLHVPKQHLTVYIFEEIAKEMLLIVLQKLQKLTEAGVEIPDAGDTAQVSSLTTHSPKDPYNGATMDLCVLTLLCHVLVTLITTQPEEYSYLERHFKVFAKYLHIKSPRKYKAENNPITRLHQILGNFKTGLKREALTKLEESVSRLQSSPSNSESNWSLKQSVTSSATKTEPDGLEGGFIQKQVHTTNDVVSHRQKSLFQGSQPGDDGSMVSHVELSQSQGTDSQQRSQPSQQLPQQLPQDQYVPNGMPPAFDPAHYANSFGSQQQGFAQPMNAMNQFPDHFGSQVGSMHLQGNNANTQNGGMNFQTNTMNAQINPMFTQMGDMNAQIRVMQTQMNTVGGISNTAPANVPVSMGDSMDTMASTYSEMNDQFDASEFGNNGAVNESKNITMNNGQMYGARGVNQMAPLKAQLNNMYLDSFSHMDIRNNSLGGSNFTYGHNSLDTPYHKMMGTLFSNGGEEFMLEKERVNWDGLFST